MLVERVKSCMVAILQRALDAPSLSSLSHETPPPDLLHQLKLCLSQLVPETAAANSSHILTESLQQMLHFAIGNLQSGLSQEKNDVIKATILYRNPSPWHVLGRITTPTHYHPLTVLQRFSSTVCLLLSSLMEVATPLHCETNVLDSFLQASIWKQLVVHLQTVPLSYNPEWSRFLATMGVCLVASEVGAVLAKFSFGALSWCKASIKEILESLEEQFPARIYKIYQKWENQEVGGAYKLMQTHGGGLVLKV